MRILNLNDMAELFPNLDFASIAEVNVGQVSAFSPLVVRFSGTDLYAFGDPHVSVQSVPLPVGWSGRPRPVYLSRMFIDADTPLSAAHAGAVAAANRFNENVAENWWTLIDYCINEAEASHRRTIEREEAAIADLVVRRARLDALRG